MVNVLFVELPDTICVVPATQITSLGIHDGSADEGDSLVVVLEDLLETPTEATPRMPRTLVVVRGNQKTVFRTSSNLTLGELTEDSFFNLPGILSASSCRPWIRGLVTLPEASKSCLGVWLDLDQLANTLWSGDSTVESKHA